MMKNAKHKVDKEFIKYFILTIFLVIIAIFVLFVDLKIENNADDTKAVLQETNEPYLYYDENTLTVYVIYYEKGKYNFVSPYYGSNGLPCKYINGQIVEIHTTEVKDILTSKLERGCINE